MSVKNREQLPSVQYFEKRLKECSCMCNLRFAFIRAVQESPEETLKVIQMNTGISDNWRRGSE